MLDDIELQLLDRLCDGEAPDEVVEFARRVKRRAFEVTNHRLDAITAALICELAIGPDGAEMRGKGGKGGKKGSKSNPKGPRKPYSEADADLATVG